MSKRTVFTTITSLPTGITRETVLETLHTHVEMIDLNPLVEERHPCKAPARATPEEYHCIWYSLTDKIHYLPGGLYSGRVTYNACFHDLSNGLQTHCYAPMGLDIKGKWTLGGTLPHEPKEAVEIGLGAPKSGLWLREDVDMKCNILMTSFVKKTLKKAHATLVDRLVEKSHLLEANNHNNRIWETKSNYSYHSNVTGGSPGFPPPSIVSSPDPEPHDRTSTISSHPSPYPRSSSTWSSPNPSQGGVDPAYQRANPYAPDVKHQSFQSLDTRYSSYQPAPAETKSQPQPQPQPQPQQTHFAVELPGNEIQELDASVQALKPAPLRPH